MFWTRALGIPPSSRLARAGDDLGTAAGLGDHVDAGDVHNLKQLHRDIIYRGVADNWAEARLEWRLVDVAYADEPQRCLCGHFPIIEICNLRNLKNGNEAEVGNVCVGEFMVGINSGKVFDCIRRIRKDDIKPLNPDTFELFHNNGVLTEWEYSFCKKTWRDRNLGTLQMITRRNINRKILRNLSKGKFF
jgi:hypothetical protein